MHKILSGKNLVKTYGKEKEASKVLNGVNVAISAGEFVAVMGPSGCGKSTLLFVLSGTDTIDSGSVEFDGEELSRLNENELADIRRAKMGFVFQQPTMLKNLNILDNIILSAVQGNRKDIAKITQKARTLIEKSGIPGIEEREITEVSGGQLQRASICRALMNEPEILFADEPTGALNSKSSEEIMALFVEINKNGTAIFLVTHDAKVASRADRVLFMKDGAIKTELTFGDIDGYDLEDRMNQIAVHMRDLGI